MMFFQMKAIRKGTKPPLWRRVYIPSNVTFSQLALLLEEILEIPKSDRFEFEFYNKKDRIIEWHEEDENVHDFYYSYLNAPDTFINDWLMKEKWFTFRVKDRHIDAPEYRVEIEKLLDGIRMEIEGTMVPLTYPMIIKEAIAQNDRYWTNGMLLNKVLKQRYFMEQAEAKYQYMSELIKDIDAKHGMQYCTELVNRDIHTKKSTNALIGEATEIIGKHLGIEQGKNDIHLVSDTKKMQEYKKLQEDNLKSKNVIRKSSMEQLLNSYTKQDLIDIATAMDYKFKASRKDGMVYEIARKLLEPQFMREQLLAAEEEELDALEDAIKKGCFEPSETEWENLETIYDLCYIAEYEDDMVQVPDEVKVVYGILEKSGYREFHRKAKWLLICIRAFDQIHVAAPVKILYRMYKQNKDVIVPYTEFLELIEKIPERMSPSIMIEDIFVSKSTIKNGIYKKIMKWQREVDYYIPTMKEIISYAKDGYPSCEQAYMDLYDFFYHDLKQEDEECEKLCLLAFRTFTSGEMMSDYMEILTSENIEFASEKQVQKFASIIMNVNNHSRMYELRGHKPLEMSGNAMAGKNGKFPTIVPMNSDVAGMLEAGRSQLEAMGFDIDTDETATQIPVLQFPNGIFGNSESGVKKIYPNDPCPCGSGKKYKKCCGRGK